MGDLFGQINSVKEKTDSVLEAARNAGVPVDKLIAVPLSKLPSLGNGVSSLVPALSNVTQTLTMESEGLSQLANADMGAILQKAKSGDLLEAFRPADGGSKLAQLKSSDPLSGASSVALKANPATMMMAVALFSIEKDLGKIEETQKEILAFANNKRKSEIEGDVDILKGIMTNYKYSWDNDMFVKTSHNQAFNIRRSAIANIGSYQKDIADDLKTKQLIVRGAKVDSTLANMLEQFKYYRLSIYTLALSYLADIMLSGNFKEEYIQSAIREINKRVDDYKSLFSDCSAYLEKMSKGSVETNFLKGAGAASNAMGKLIGNIPKVKDKPANGFLIKKGEQFKDSAQKGSVEVVESFSEVSDPNVEEIMKQLEDLNQIYNKTTKICVDQDNLYLVAK